jgi:hypothetical protein
MRVKDAELNQSLNPVYLKIQSGELSSVRLSTVSAPPFVSRSARSTSGSTASLRGRRERDHPSIRRPRLVRAPTSAAQVTAERSKIPRTCR